MKLVCCDCGKGYEVEWTPPKNIKRYIDLGYKSAGAIIECPHCGLKHYLLIIKLRPKLEEGSEEKLKEKYPDLYKIMEALRELAKR